ncbi:MAG: hypothetical protein ACUVUD_06575 [bacterium]
MLGRVAVLALVLLPGFVFAQPDTAGGDSVAVLPYRLVEAGPVEVRVKMAEKMSRQLTIGDRVKVELVVAHPRGLTVSPPFVEKSDEVLLLDQKHQIRYKRDTVLDVYHLTLALFTVGKKRLPPFLVTYRDVGGLCAASSDSLTVEVKSLLSERMEDINDIKAQVEYPNLLPVVLLLVLLVLIAGGYLGYRLLVRYREKKAVAVSPLSPWEEAEAALATVPVAELVRTGQLKLYYYLVSEIVKRYLTRRFGFPAIDETTTEILRELRQRKLPELDQFNQFFFEVDRVKYAKVIPGQPEKLVDFARQLVARTKPAPEPNTAPVPAVSGG